eukprot:1145960-Pelagomonas_calceolata.AAC.7
MSQCHMRMGVGQGGHGRGTRETNMQQTIPNFQWYDHTMQDGPPLTRTLQTSRVVKLISSVQ